MKGGNILSLLRDYDSRKSMDGSAPDAPEVSADIDSPESRKAFLVQVDLKPTEPGAARPRKVKMSLPPRIKRQVIRPSTPQSLTRMETLSRQNGVRKAAAVPTLMMWKIIAL